MALPMRPSTSWTRGIDLPSQLFEAGSDDYELYEADDEFVLTVELPGFDLEDIAVHWEDGVRASGASAGSADGTRTSAGVLNVSAEHEDEQRGRQKTYHRRFRFPKRIVEEEIEAEYTNGVLEVTLPVESGATARGTEIEVHG